MEPSSFEINVKNKKSLFTFPDEEILIAKRQHWVVLASSFFLTPAAGLIFILASFVLFRWVMGDFFLFLLSTLTIIALCSTIIIKSVINWYFHLYIVTNHKLLEIDYKPFFAESISDILLDLVRCTEIDIHTDGIINQIFNKGDIYITFDRPTHEEGFVLKNIRSPRQTSVLLSEILTPGVLVSKKTTKHTWLKNKNKDKDNSFQYMEELLPQKEYYLWNS